MHGFRQRVRWRCGRLLAGIKQVARRGAASLRRDGLPPGAQHQALPGHAPRSAVAALDRFRPLRRGRLRRTARLRRVEPGRLRRHPAGLRVPPLAAQRTALPRGPGQRRAHPRRAASHWPSGAAIDAGRRPAARRAFHARLLPPYEPRQPRGHEVPGQGHHAPLVRQDADASSSATASSRTTWSARWA